jgi:hypothetical protein
VRANILSPLPEPEGIFGNTGGKGNSS